MACREYKDTLSAYIDDELKPLTRLRVEAHLRGCRRCRRQLRQTRRATEMVRGLERVEAPVFAMQRARSIALGGRARGWERLRGGLLSRPQTLPLKPVLLAGLAFMMVLVISQTFDTVVAPRMEAQTATPAPKTPPPSPGQPAPGLPGTLSADRLSDSQKAEIARRVLQAHPQQAPVQGPEPAVALPDEDASAQPATLEEMPQQAVELDPVQAETGRVAQAATEPDQALRNETASPQASGAAPAQQETRIAAAVPPTGALSRPLNVATPEAAAPTPTPPPTSADEIAAPAAARAGRGASPDVLELGETYRQVLVLAQRDDGQLEATFHAADIDRSGSLRRFDDGEPAAVMKGETAVQAEEDLPPPEPDLDTGIAPPLPVYRPAPVLRQQGRGHRELGPLSPALLRVNVLADGTVGSLALISSSGLRWLDRAVVEAVRAWEFRPAERHQQAVPVSIELLVEFELE